ncbi:hypothetical protein PRN20_18120 [Devosia sp. ZB163]|uniref:hypothetical protein n=1 Tax=Devosia sp. ZB163 TaxID=3025938 RepID=UPI00235F8BFE|nr:hypothetical protein [Devosia sp. ZB163]MDC9825654.1 hypothetical protein [Devosia sp. ZB163]
MSRAFQCAHCTATATTSNGNYNRAAKIGAPLYCGKECAGLARRKWKSPAQRKEEKRVYDAARRAELADEIKAAKRAYHLRTYDPAKAAVERKKRMPRHVEYCRRPEYRAWKRDYDRNYRAAKEYGEFAECFLLVMDIRAECLSQMTDYEIRLEKGTLSKTQKRRREYERANRKEPEVGPLGDFERRQGWEDGGLAG